MEIEPGRLYKLSEMGAATGIPSSTLKRWAINGQIPAIRTGKLWRIAGADILHLMKHGTQEPGAKGQDTETEE